MSAPNDTTWGGVVGSGSSEGRIGIARTWVDYPTFERATVQVWFWSKYTVSDTNNSCDLAVLIDGTNHILRQGASANISHPTNSAWSTQNQTKIAEYTIDLPRRTSDYTVVFNSSFQRIEVLGSNVMYAQRNYTVYALESHTVSYNANGGSGAPNSQTKWYGSTLTLSSTKPSRTGHDFVGWGTSSTDTTVDYYAGGQYGTDANITLYAIWRPHTYSVVYDANGGTNAPSNQTKTYGVNLTLSGTKPTRTDYNFLGWNTYKTATEPLYNAGDVYTNNSAITLYAVWEVAYIKPRITNYSAYRCDANGEADEYGTNVAIVFDWQTDLTGVTFRPFYKKKEEGEEKYISLSAVALNGTEGKNYKHIISGVTFSTEVSYNIKLNLSDSYGYSTVYMLVHSIFIPIDSTPDGRNMSFGEPAKDTTEEADILRFAYKTVDLAPKEELRYRGENFFGAKQIWSGQSLMNETHSITFNKPISEMKNGILLVFARNGTYNVTTYFVPKETVSAFGRTTHCFPLCTELFDYIGAKSLYISDTKIEGHTNNDATAKNATSGITYHNEAFYLLKVYEV